MSDLDVASTIWKGIVTSNPSMGRGDASRQAEELRAWKAALEDARGSSWFGSIPASTGGVAAQAVQSVKSDSKASDVLASRGAEQALTGGRGGTKEAPSDGIFGSPTTAPNSVRELPTDSGLRQSSTSERSTGGKPRGGGPAIREVRLSRESGSANRGVPARAVSSESPLPESASQRLPVHPKPLSVGPPPASMVPLTRALVPAPANEVKDGEQPSQPQPLHPTPSGVGSPVSKGPVAVSSAPANMVRDREPASQLPLAQPTPLSVDLPEATGPLAPLSPLAEEVKEGEPSVRASKGVAGLVEERTPVRCHAEWTPDGLRLWLGLDHQAGRDLSELEQMIMRQLNPVLASIGIRVDSVICNGRVVRGKGVASQVGGKPAEVISGPNEAPMGSLVHGVDDCRLVHAFATSSEDL